MILITLITNNHNNANNKTSNNTNNNNNNNNNKWSLCRPPGPRVAPARAWRPPRPARPRGAGGGSARSLEEQKTIKVAILLLT